MAIACGMCENPDCSVAGTYCKLWRGATLDDYNGIRYTADGFDCALPISIDTYNMCSYRCLYCFSNFLSHDPVKKASYSANPYGVRAIKLTTVERFLSGEAVGTDTQEPLITDLYGHTVDGRKCPIQWGALSDPFCYIERHHGRSLEMMDLFLKYRHPVRISTKGADIINSRIYLDKFSIDPTMWWVAWSFISIDDEVLSSIDKSAPNATQRLKAIADLSKLGVKTSLRLRPIFPGITDSTTKHPHGWRELLHRAKEAGVVSVSMEFAFVPGAMEPHVKELWREIERVSKVDICKWYKNTSIHGKCLRSSRTWKEEFTFRIYEEAKSLGLNFGISDPHWKELNDYGCCCGIPSDDKFFGGWQRKNATNAIVEARDHGCLVSCEKYTPQWAYRIKMDRMCQLSGPQKALQRATYTWADKLRDTWNDLRGARGPLGYFGGCLMPKNITAKGDVQYRYCAVPRTNGKRTPLWKL